MLLLDYKLWMSFIKQSYSCHFTNKELIKALGY